MIEMIKWVALSIAAILTVTIWTIFITMVMQGEGNTMDRAVNLSKKTASTEFNRHLLEENDLISEFVLNEHGLGNIENDSDMKLDLSEVSDRKTEKATAVTEHTVVRNGDGVGYGEGVSIDALLHQFSNND
jgi:hypothetical protein